MTYGGTADGARYPGDSHPNLMGALGDIRRPVNDTEVVQGIVDRLSEQEAKEVSQIAGQTPAELRRPKAITNTDQKFDSNYSSFRGTAANG